MNLHLRKAALISALAGGVGSEGFLLYAGRHNASRLLAVLFTLWVLSPFVAILVVDPVLRHWSTGARTALYVVTPVVALASLASYGDVALWPPASQAASAFVVVPPASWLLMAIAARAGAAKR